MRNAPSSAQSVSPVTPFGVWIRLVAGNAFLLSLLYFSAGLAAELLRHVYPARWVSRVLVTLEQTPGRALEAVGLMDPLREAYQQGDISRFGVRWAFGLTMAAIILITAMVMAFLMALLQRLWARRRVR